MHSFNASVGVWLMPLPIAFTLASLGVVARIVGRARVSRAMLASGALVVLLASLGPVAHALLVPLEMRYVSVLDASRLVPTPRYVAVLGGGYRPSEGLPITSVLGRASVMRLMEGVRLFRQLAQSRLVVSGGPSGENPPTAQGYLTAAIELGVPRDSIIVIDTPVDTAAEIRALHARLGDAPVLLVTSAAHMRRAMEYCSLEGLHATAAPTDHLTVPTLGWSLSSLRPSGTALHQTETALHEYLGLIALHLGATS